MGRPPAVVNETCLERLMADRPETYKLHDVGWSSGGGDSGSESQDKSSSHELGSGTSSSLYCRANADDDTPNKDAFATTIAISK